MKTIRSRASVELDVPVFSLTRSRTDRSPEESARIDDASVILAAALGAVDPRSAVRHALSFDPAKDTIEVGGRVYRLEQGGRVVVVGGGKAAAAMALGVLDVLGDRVDAGELVVKDGHRGVLDDARIVVHEAAHPWPDERGLSGTRAMMRLVEGAGPRDLVIVLVSGGGSALLELLPPEVTLGDLRALTDALLRSGASIDEMNVVRKHVSSVKGGQLAARAAPARVVALVVSDVVGAPLDVIASGPTVADPSTFVDALEVLRRRELTARVPPPVLAHLERGAVGAVAETPKPGDPRLDPASVHNVLVADIAHACDAAHRTAGVLGYESLLLTTFLEGEAREVAKAIASIVKEVRARRAPCKPPAALLFGGETTVTLRGSGKGGRNQEFALAAAVALDGVERVLVVSFATDGTDGPTEAAGGLVTGTTVAEARARGVDAALHLANNDAYPFLEAAGGLLVTGPTGTNVCDLIVALVW